MLKGSDQVKAAPKLRARGRLGGAFTPNRAGLPAMPSKIGISIAKKIAVCKHAPATMPGNGNFFLEIPISQAAGTLAANSPGRKIGGSPMPIRYSSAIPDPNPAESIPIFGPKRIDTMYTPNSPALNTVKGGILILKIVRIAIRADIIAIVAISLLLVIILPFDFSELASAILAEVDETFYINCLISEL